MKTSSVFALLIGLVAGTSFATLASAAPPQPLLANVPFAGAQFAGAPPAFVVPLGGRFEVVLRGRGQKYTIYRADGRLLAEAVLDHRGLVTEALFYQEDGTPQMAAHASYVSMESAGKGQRDGKNRALRSARPPRTLSRRSGGCFSAAWEPGIGTWHLNHVFEWYFVSGSTPDYIQSIDATEASLRGARAAWAYNRNNCQVPDNSRVLIAYYGRLQTSFGYNYASTVGFVDPEQVGCSGGGYVVTACTATWLGYPTPYIAESDTRLNGSLSEVPFINGAAPGRIDIQSIMTHESGHSIGMGDVYDTGNVMDQLWRSGDLYNSIEHRMLGRGDATGNNAQYPG